MRILSKWFFKVSVLCCSVCASLFATAQTLTLLSADYGVEGNRVDVTCRVQSLVQNGFLNFQITNYALGGDPVPEQPKEFRIRARDYRSHIQDFYFHEKEDVSIQLADHGPNCASSGGNSPMQGRLGDDDQQRFDSYYSRWLNYKATNNQGEVVSMQNRMLDVYNHYGIPPATPFSQVASPVVVQETNNSFSDLQIMVASYGIPGHTMDVTGRIRGMVRNGTLNIHVNNDSMGGDPSPEKHKALTLTYRSGGQTRTIIVRESSDMSIP
jgi:hypothetical protein